MLENKVAAGLLPLNESTNCKECTYINQHRCIRKRTNFNTTFAVFLTRDK